jgi:Ni,Fe-hydrogenase maturation factor
MKQGILILGYGNPDRQDDGVAWHVLKDIILQLGLPAPKSPDDLIPSYKDRVHFQFMLQLVPEAAELISQFDSVCFVDAHTGEIKVPVSAVRIDPKFQSSPFTHHLTPFTCLELANSIYHKSPRGYLVSVRGFSFQFEQKLTDQTGKYAKTAAGIILKWIRTGKFEERKST